MGACCSLSKRHSRQYDFCQSYLGTELLRSASIERKAHEQNGMPLTKKSASRGRHRGGHGNGRQLAGIEASFVPFAGTAVRTVISGQALLFFKVSRNFKY